MNCIIFINHSTIESLYQLHFSFSCQDAHPQNPTWLQSLRTKRPMVHSAANPGGKSRSNTRGIQSFQLESQFGMTNYDELWRIDLLQISESNV